jgi:spore maturation protein CgeB
LKVLIVGNWHSDIHEKPVFRAFKKLNHNVYKFKWHQYFDASGDIGFFTTVLNKAQRKYIIGPIINKINDDFLEYAKEVKPDVIFIYRGTHVFHKTLIEIKAETKALILGYNNDDPFSPHYSGWEWRHFIKCIPVYDLVLSYRKLNIRDYWKAGAKRVKLLRSWFIAERNFPTHLSEQEIERFGCDVVFIGHYEADGRKEVLESLIRNGIDLKIFGPGWEKVKWNEDMPDNIAPIRPVINADYNKALNGAKIALCFFSKLNRDSYTRRCFEIPASGTLLLSQHSDDLESLYTVGKEADTFKDVDELLVKIEQYLSDESLRLLVANSGRERAIRDGYDVVSRIENLTDYLDSIFHVYGK